MTDEETSVSGVGLRKFTKRACEALGIQFDLRLVGQANDSSVALGEGVEEAIVEANNDDDVGGVMVRLPLLLPSFLRSLGADGNVSSCGRFV